MVKVLFALAKYLTWWFIKPLVLRFCVANLTHMLRTSSSNKTHVLVASNNISLSYLEGRIYILITLLNPFPVLIILLNPLPVLVALEILRDILSFTRSFMINTRPLVGCLENSDRKVKQFHVIPRLASSHLVYSSSIQYPKWIDRMCLVLHLDSQFVSQKLSRNRHCTDWTAWFEWLLYHLQW